LIAESCIEKTCLRAYARPEHSGIRDNELSCIPAPIAGMPLTTLILSGNKLTQVILPSLREFVYRIIDKQGVLLIRLKRVT